MSFKVYNSGNLLVLQNTVTWRTEKVPKDQCWYEFNPTDAPILYSLYYAYPERDFLLDQPYTAFQDENGNSFADDVIFQTYLDGLLGTTSSNTSVNVGNLPLTAFGEVKAESKTAQVQAKFPYGAAPDLSQELTNNVSSTVTYSDSNAIVTCAAVANSFSQIRSIDTIRYAPGQGSDFSGTCIFTSGVANSSQVFGAGDDDEGLFFGYNGTEFGVLRRAYGSLEIKSLEITAGADGGGGNFNITIDGTVVNVIVSGSDTISEVCAAIVAKADDFYNAGRGWEVHTDDNISIEFISLVAETAAGVFSFADVDSGVTAGSFTQEVVGVVPTEEWTAQTAWNLDKMDGSGDSVMTLDPTQGNVYQIEWQYLGYGSITYFIEDSLTGIFQPVHRVQYANSAIVPTVLNPTLHITLIAKTETGYSGGALVMKTASLAGFIQGKENPTGVRRSISITKTSTTSETVLLIIHNELDFNGLKNKITVYPDFLNFACDGSKETTINLIKTPTSILGATTLTDVQTGVSVMQYSSAGTTVTGGFKLLSFVVPGGGGEKVNLAELVAKIRPGERYVFTQNGTSGGLGDTSIGISWVERV